ncbi:MAG TPA: glycolate oxidase subunit GlcF [Gammaproteobacteria bacterium]
MQTRFKPEQLADPDVREAEQVLRKCVHCGFCTATCPTYVLLGDELDSPRGRIYLIKDMLENDRPATADVVRHIDRCLSCLACMTTCPSGVHYQHLIDHARVHVERTYHRPLRERWIRELIAAVMPYPKRFAVAVRLGMLARPVLAWMPARVSRLRGLLQDRFDPPGGARVAPTSSADRPAAGVHGAAARPTRRVALLEGCVESVLAPEIHASAKRVLAAAGVDVVSVPGCCGSIVHHLGRERDNRRLAGALIESLEREIEGSGLDAILSTASGCGTHAKDYGFLFRNDPSLAAKAASVAARVRDVSEYLHEVGLPAPRRRLGLRVAYHSACSMQHGQKVDAEPRELLARAGFEVRTIPEGHLCCGSAGTYNLLHPEIADRLRDRKIANIARTEADVVATGNIGCIVQLASAAQTPVVHTVQLLDWALGGPVPAGVEPVVREVP